MSRPPPSVPIEVLLAHEPFVRALARSLVWDEERAGDVAQEVWLAALRSPPRATGSLRAWLARVTRNVVRNQHRQGARRARREREAAERTREERGEASDAVGEAYERLEVHREVVEAVLALEEPYRSIVVQRHYEGLTLAEIARRRGVPDGTVRSWMSRGLERLRERLDRRHGGDRRAWGAALLRFVGDDAASAPGASLAPHLPLALGLALLAAAPLALGALLRGPPSAGAARALFPPAEGPLAAASPASTPRGSARAPAAAPRPQRPRPPSPIARSELETLSIPELYRLVRQAQERLAALLLAPGPREQEALALLEGEAGAGVARLVDGARWPFALADPGGGAVFSFAAGRRLDDERADLALADGELRVAPRSGQRGWLLPLGPLAASALPRSAGAPPAALAADDLSRWQALASEPADALAERAAELGLRTRARPRAGEGWLLRAASPREHDLLVAFCVLADEQGVLALCWRVLAARPVEGSPQEKRAPEPDWWVGEPSERLARLGADELAALLDEARAVARPRLLEPEPELRARHATLAARDDAGLVRLAFRGRYEGLLGLRGGGATFSFATRSHDAGAEPDLSTDRGRLLSGLGASAFGLFVPLGEVPLEQLQPAASTPPPGLDADGRAAWALAFEARAGERGFVEEDARRARALGLPARPRARRGESVLLRSVRPGEHDVLVALRTLAEDEHGLTLAWRVLRAR